jgi:RsiW-degrading membrane proteinase PrsW (M82 family)
VIFVVGMFATASTDRSIPQEELLNRFIIFSGLLGLYIGLGAYYFIYRLCGKFKPWWLLLGSGLLTILLFFIPVWSLFELVFRQILPGDVFGLIEGKPSVSTSVVANFFGSNIFLTLLVVFFFGAGLAEELFKALPILIAFFLGRIFNQHQRLGVSEPLDGILLGAASAVGFTLFETLLQYVPEAIQRGGAVAGLQLLIPRILGSVAGHMAYSGYFGYFIGLSVLKPRQSIQILVVGYLSASILHALWNTTSVFSLWLSALVGIVSYILLVAAILKARALSPTRSQNFATRFFN